MTGPPRKRGTVPERSSLFITNRAEAIPDGIPGASEYDNVERETIAAEEHAEQRFDCRDIPEIDILHEASRAVADSNILKQTLSYL
jgi:hypothetical protein